MLESTKVLKSMRAKKGYDIYEIPNFLPIHRVTYKRYENNPLKVNLDMLFHIVEVLDGDLDELFNALKQDYMSYKNHQENPQEKRE